jgi:hypothetical protein
MWMLALIRVIHSVVAVKCTVIVLTTDLAWLVRSSIRVSSVVGDHIGVGLLVGVAMVEVFEVNRLIGKGVTVIASWRESSVVLGSKMLAAWIESWGKSCLLEVGGILMVEV